MRNKDVPTNKTAVPFESTPKAPGQSGPPLISFFLPTLACPSAPRGRVTTFCFIPRCEYRAVRHGIRIRLTFMIPPRHRAE